MSFTVALGDRVEGDYANQAQWDENFAGQVVLVEPTHFVVDDDSAGLVTCFFSNIEHYDPAEPDTAVFNAGDGAFDILVYRETPLPLVPLERPFVEVKIDRSPRGRLSSLAEHE
jgi:hypothetical protein